MEALLSRRLVRLARRCDAAPQHVLRTCLSRAGVEGPTCSQAVRQRLRRAQRRAWPPEDADFAFGALRALNVVASGAERSPELLASVDRVHASKSAQALLGLDGALTISAMLNGAKSPDDARRAVRRMAREVRALGPGPAVHGAHSGHDACAPEWSAVSQAETVLQVMREHGIQACDQGDYYNPLNSDVYDVVLGRKRGIPVSLSVVFLAIARLAGMSAWGISTPQHFLCRLDGVSHTVTHADGPRLQVDDSVLVDCFTGRVLHAASYPEGGLAAVDWPVVWARMVRNLQRVDATREDFWQALHKDLAEKDLWSGLRGAALADPADAEAAPELPAWHRAYWARTTRRTAAA